jgi:hypothetical protein
MTPHHRPENMSTMERTAANAVSDGRREHALTSIDPHRALKNAGVYLESAWR